LDTFKHKGRRRRLIELLEEKGITDEKVLEAMASIPRHGFVEGAFSEEAYEDKALPIHSGQTISQPFTVAFQTQLLDIKPGKKVLEIGTGSGYQCCVLLHLTKKVFTIERQRALFEKTKKFLPKIGYKAKFFYGDGFKGLPGFAPFDKIIITAGAPNVPEDLVKQLKVGGVMVIPVNEDGSQRMMRITKENDGSYVSEEFGLFRFVPMLPDRAKDV